MTKSELTPTADEAVGFIEVISTKQLVGKKVWGATGAGTNVGTNTNTNTNTNTDTGADTSTATNTNTALKKLGRVKAFVFHPTQNKCVGFLVKRPDLALMFHRRDLFVAYNGFNIIDERIIVGNFDGAKDKGALKAAGVNLDNCVLWQAMPVVCEDGTYLGIVGDILCEQHTGNVYSIEINKGATANTVLGTLNIPAEEILGLGAFADINPQSQKQQAQNFSPALIVDNVAQQYIPQGGLAEKAGSATAVVAHHAKRAINTVAPKAKETTAAAGKAINQGAFLTGQQIAKSSGMFQAFKEEFNNALHDKDSTE